jgi:hypothetical protein
MTDATGGNAPPDEHKRLVIENAILAFRPEVVRQYPRDPPPQPSLALTELADAANIPRLVKHRSLIDGLRRATVIDTSPSPNLDDEARHVLASTLEPGPPEDSQRDPVDQAKRRLDEVVAAPGLRRLQPQHWQLWVQTTNDIFRFTRHEQTFEACNDEQHVAKATPDGQLVSSRLIIAQFWSDMPPVAFRKYVDPRNWPQCSPFWRSVEQLRPIVQLADGYDWDFNETVDIITQMLTVPLRIGYRELPDQSRIWTQFNISRPFYSPATEVDVDTGTVSAESVPGGPAPTLVRATKYLHWRDPNRPDLTALLCDFGWCELMEEMAYGCAQGFPPGNGSHTEAADGTKTSVDAAITQFAEAVTTQCQQGISDAEPLLEQLIGRFTGTSWDPGWINDLLEMALVTANRYGDIAHDIRRFADSLRDATAERDGHG